MLATLALVLLAQVFAATPSPTASPSSVIVAPEFTLYHFWTTEVRQPQADLSNGLLTFTVNSRNIHVNGTVGTYAFPTVGFPLLPDNQPSANEQLYSPVPVAALTYNFNSHFGLAVGKFGALLGQESPFTYENLNVQRGLGWNMEPAISRGVQAAYSNGRWSATLQENDAYYSGSNRAVEALVGWAPSPNTSVQFAAFVPGTNVPPNPTVSVGNKAEYDLMYARTIGKMQLFPYFLWVHSPASRTLDYTHSEDAYAAVLIGMWTFSSVWSLAFRYESARNRSAPSDSSPNADLVGFGAGSGATSQTLTPAYHFNNGGVLRLEYSHVSATGLNQSRYGLEFGVMH